jgi:hypothetical protein
VLAAQLANRAGLAQKSIDGVGALKSFGQEKLQRDRFVQVDVHGPHDHAHPSHAEDRFDDVLSVDAIADRDGRGSAPGIHALAILT